MSKTKTISMRLTEDENNIIKTKADKAGMSMSRFIVSSAISDNGLTAADKQRVYQLKVVIQDLAKQIVGAHDDPMAKQIYSEVGKLWQLLK